MELSYSLKSIKISVLICFIFSSYFGISQQKMQESKHNFTSFTTEKYADLKELSKFSNANDHPEYGILPFNAPCSDCIEIIEDRTQHSRVFKRLGTNGKEVLTQKGYSALHYKDANGRWITYNPKLKQISPFEYQVDNPFYKIEINTNQGSIFFENKTAGFKPLVFHNQLTFEAIDEQGNVLSSISSNWSNFTAGEEGIRVIDIFPHVDLEILIYRETIKTNFKVKQNVGEFRIKESVNQDFISRLNQNLDQYEVLNFQENGEFAYEIGEIKIFGANAQERSYVKGFYTVEGSDVYYNWSQDEFANLNYPVTIDPTVNTSGTLPQGSIAGAGTWANNGSFDVGCLYNLSVATPANCQITDIQWSFTYSAQNGAVLADGACKFYYGACESPSTAGFFWFCNNTTAGGTCAGTNISIFSDFQSCVPAPQCTPYNMDFTMEFYDAYGAFNALNCDPTYISAAADWTMTIIGETVDQPSAPTSTAPGNTICEGSSTDLSASGSYGVPPYTYSWNNGGGTGSTVTVSPTTTTTYTCTITDACGQTATNDITITVQAAPDAGTNATVSFCTSDPVSSLLNELGGTPDGTGSWTGPSALGGGSSGDFDPATMNAGTYTYTVPGTAPCTDASSTVTVSFNTSPDAGTNGSIALCTSDPSTDLFNELGGTPDAGGTWSPAMASGTGVFDPAVDAAGTYTYTVTNGCGSATADVTVTFNPAPDAGTNGSITLCTADPATDLFNELGGTPDAGGTWSPAMASGTGVFDPAVDAAGTYTYTVTNGCGSATADVTVTVTSAPDAGTNGSIALCTSDPSTDLFNELGGTPDAGGTWSPAMASGTGVFDPAVDPAGTYTYTVSASCGTASADVVVSFNPAPDPGTNGSLIICASDPASDLFNELGGTPDAGGSWSPAMASGTGMFDPAVDPAGTYTYTVTNGCGSATADVVVTINSSPDPGTNGTATFCANDPTDDLFNYLGGTPDAGGSWSPAMASGTGVFDPAVDAAGTYTYSVNACGGGFLTADVVVTINPVPDAGTNGTITLCATDPSTDLFNELGGTPDAGGSWSPAMASGTGMFDPAVDPAGTYTYTVTNGCGSATADVVVTINSSPDPGTNGTATFCANDPTDDLFNYLGGTPDAGGSWSPAMASGTGVFDPAVDAAGTYTYSVNACGGGFLTADVVVTINPVPDAGTNGTITLCATDPSTNLFNELGGTPDAGGSWSPALTSGTGVLDPSVDPSGIYTYTVTNSCGSSSAEVEVTIDPCAIPAPGFIMSDTLICMGECITLIDTTANNPLSWSWDFGGGATPDSSFEQHPTFCPDTIGIFTIKLIVSNANGTDSLTQTYTVGEVPSVNGIGDTTINMHGEATLNSIVSPTGGSYIWTDMDEDENMDCLDCPSITVTPILSTDYALTYTTDLGCTASDTVHVFVNFEDLIGVPNGFSPNGDGNNEVLYVLGIGIETMNFVIYNRYGQKIFQTDNQSIGWDGSFRGVPENPGVFVWYLEYTLIDGSSNMKKGNVTLLK
ncbi:MAG: gliding motility-associated C-terminal domain-containing protein [Crocinitomicaceae bacterium]